MNAPKILVFAGSARKDSFNKKLAKLAADALKAQGAEATFLDLADYPLPLYDGDLEDAEGLPENAKKLKKVFSEHQGFLIASPEYNSSITPLLKNTIDWVSRPETDDEPALSCYKGKVAAIVATSPGMLGGMRVLVPLRMLLENIYVMVIPNQLAIPKAYEAFDDNAQFTNPTHKAQLDEIVKALAETVKKLT